MLPLSSSSGKEQRRALQATMGRDSKLMEQVFQLKLTSKSLVRQARKCEAEEAKEKLKVKKAIEKGNTDGARVYAQNAIRKRSEQLNYLRLASRLDAVVARLGSQDKTQAIGKSMAGIVKSLQGAMAVGNMQKITNTMDQFEKAFVNVEVQSEFVERAMAGSTSLSTPEDSVNGLMQQVADDYGLEVTAEMPQPGMHRIVAGAAAAATPAGLKSRLPVASEDELCRRLAQLKNKS